MFASADYPPYPDPRLVANDLATALVKELPPAEVSAAQPRDQ